MSNSYWNSRDFDMLYNQQVGVAEAQLAKEYKRCLKETQAQLVSMYDEILTSTADGTLLVSDLYKYNRYYDLTNNLNRELTKLGFKELAIMDDRLVNMYQLNAQMLDNKLGFTTAINQNAIKSAINAVWCGDGRHYSDRVWRNKALLEESVKKGLVDCIARGVPRDELIKTIMAEFNTGFYQASRIARTELTYIQTRSTIDRYAAAGLEKVEFYAEIDGKTSDMCREKHEKEFPLNKLEIGVNAPPLHPFCRSCLLPVI